MGFFTMKLKSFISKFFLKRSENKTGFALACIRNIVRIPKRDDYTNDIEAEALIDKYKKEYLNTLKTNRTIISTDLMPTELQLYKNIYIDLLASICTEDNSDVSLEKINKANSRSLEIMIIRLKLDIYINAVKDQEKEARLRVIALTEMLNTIIFSKSKERAIINEIDNLYFAISNFMTQILAMEKEKESFLKDLSKR